VQFGGTTQTVDQSTVTVRRILATTVPVAVTDCKPPSGPLSIKNLNTGEMATTGLLFTYTVPQPTILQMSPVAGRQAGGDTVTITGKDFESNVRVEIGGIAAVNPQIAASGASLTAQTPAYNGALDSVPCDDNGDGQIGMRYRPKAVDVKVTSLATGCTDTFALAFSYDPTDPSCRGDVLVKVPPVADLVFAANFLTVAFSDRSTGGAPTSWKWSFGDGATSTAQNPTHTYTNPGTYFVFLTVRSGSMSDTTNKQVSVP